MRTISRFGYEASAAERLWAEVDFESSTYRTPFWDPMYSSLCGSPVRLGSALWMSAADTPRYSSASRTAMRLRALCSPLRGVSESEYFSPDEVMRLVPPDIYFVDSGKAVLNACACVLRSFPAITRSLVASTRRNLAAKYFSILPCQSR